MLDYECKNGKCGNQTFAVNKRTLVMRCMACGEKVKVIDALPTLKNLMTPPVVKTKPKKVKKITIVPEEPIENLPEVKEEPVDISDEKLEEVASAFDEPITMSEPDEENNDPEPTPVP